MTCLTDDVLVLGSCNGVIKNRIRMYIYLISIEIRYTNQINSAKFSKNHKNQEPLNLLISCFLLGQPLSNLKK